MSEPKSIAEPTKGPRRLSKQALAKVKKKKRRGLQRVEIRERRYEVRALRLQGFNITQIADKLGHDPQTIRKDLQVIREEQSAEAKTFDRDQHVAEAQERFDLIEQKAWEVFNEAKPGSATKVKALDLVRLSQSDRTKIMVDTGVIVKEQRQLEVKHTHSLEWDDDMRERVARALVEQSLKTPLLEPTPEEDLDVIDVESVETETETETNDYEYEPDSPEP
jgi:hypothetical protein